MQDRFGSDLTDPDSSVSAVKNNPYASLSVQQQRTRLPIFKVCFCCCVIIVYLVKKFFSGSKLYKYTMFLDYFVRFQNRSHILYLLETHRCLVIVGETGCGKSTQVPQVKEFVEEKDV